MTPPPDVIAAAQASARAWGVPASVSLAQWALESGWGQYEAGCRNTPPVVSHNPFGIKAESGQPAVSILTHEFTGGALHAVWAAFRVFPSLAAAFDAHARLLAADPVYTPAMLQAHDADAFAAALQGRYATDPHYAGKLLALMHGPSDLVRYDLQPGPPAPAAAMRAAA
jgi:flagellum-specific peptidoglycan hydrolase FlgJ